MRERYTFALPLPPFLSSSFSFPFLLLMALYLTPAPALSIPTALNISAPCVQQGACSYLDVGTWEGGIIPMRPSDVALVACQTPLVFTLQSQSSVNTPIYTGKLTIQGPVTFIIKDAFFLVAEMHWDDSETIVKVDNAVISIGKSQQYTTGSSLIISGSSIVNVDRIKLDYVQIINSTFTGSVFEGDINAGFGTTLTFIEIHSQNITAIGVATFTVKSLKILGIFTIVNCDSVAFDEMIMESNTTLDYTPPYLKIYYTMYTGSIRAPLDPRAQRPKLFFRENSNFLVAGVTGGKMDFVLGNNVVMRSDRYTDVRIWGLQQEPNSYATLLMPALVFYEDVTFTGIISTLRLTVSEGKSLTITSISEHDRVCSYGDLIMHSGSSFSCYGKLEQDNVQMNGSASITAETMSMKSIKAFGGTINADVYVHTEDSRPGVQLVDNTLTINGDFSLTNGRFTEVFDNKDVTLPLLLVSGEISFHNIPPLVLIYSGNWIFSQTHGKLLLAKSLRSLIFVDSGYLEVTDEWEAVHFSVRIKGGEIYITRATLELYQVLLAVAATLISIFLLLTFYYRVWKKSLTIRTNEHELQPLST